MSWRNWNRYEVKINIIYVDGKALHKKSQNVNKAYVKNRDAYNEQENGVLTKYTTSYPSVIFC